METAIFGFHHSIYKQHSQVVLGLQNSSDSFGKKNSEPIPDLRDQLPSNDSGKHDHTEPLVGNKSETEGQPKKKKLGLKFCHFNPISLPNKQNERRYRQTDKSSVTTYFALQSAGLLMSTVAICQYRWMAAPKMLQ